MSGLRKKGHNWQIWWIDHNQKPERQWETLSKSEFPYKRDAKREAQRRELEARHPSNRNVTFKEYADEYLEKRHIEKSTYDRNKYVVQAFDDFLQREFKVVKFRNVTEYMINAYINERKNKYSPAGINIDLRFLRQIFNNAFEKKVIEESPMKHIKYLREEKKVVELPSKNEVQKILDWFRKNEPLFYAWLYFQATRGWRRDELRLLRVNAVDIEGNVLYVRKTKTKEQRVARLSNEDCLVLNEHIILLKNKGLYHPTGYMFPSKKGNLLGRNRMLEKIKRSARDLGITKNITNHIFRHYVVTTITNKTSNIEVVKAITGHKDTRTIQEHYIHANTEMVDKALEITKVNTGFIL